ncbi:hypothetical protein ANANG_G00141040 [Anguilla anguilla]|uniref:Uncharacterized protein n=1 Tax=Anguilla anguilla TaxID=7936 RepID=A0A9D3MGQ1_ANGAN|nr:hypothetical protein ANANG_G00141040 [Anguilla anguilla]
MTPAGPVRLRLRDPRLCTERSRRRGDMSHLTVLLCCLILSFLSSCGNNEALTVTQSPPSITVKEGEMAQMLCCWGGTLNMERLTVEKTNNSSTTETSRSILVTAVLIPLAAVMGAICLCAFLCYWRKKKLMPYPDQASGKVGMVIHEVPHEEGEEIMEGEIGLAENEAGSTGSSHGSTQWCAVAVYESVDYFAVQTSEDR